MKSSKQPKEKEEQTFIQGNISKSASGGKKIIKSLGVQHQKRAGGVSIQLGDCIRDKGTVSQMPLKLEGKTLHSSAKMILQLFPVDESIRIGLEKDGHNPFLELTLSPRKKISSVLKHLRNKWGSSSIAVGEPMLFPFNTASDNLYSSRRWTSSEIGITAGDVHAALGSPEIFRLRYSWVSLQPNTSSLIGPEPGYVDNGCCRPMEDTSVANEMSKELEPANEMSKELEPCNKNELPGVAVQQVVSSELLNQAAHKNKDEIKSEDLKLFGSRDNDTVAEGNSSAEPSKYEEPRRGTDDMSLASLLWSDLSNISIGGLLSEASMQGRFNAEDPRSSGSRLMSQTITTDSLDAFIEKYKYPQASTTQSSDMPSSILDAENTCYSFSFPKEKFSSKDSSRQGAFSGLSDQKAASEIFKCPKSEVNAQSGVNSSNSVPEPKTDSLPCSIGAFNNDNSLGLSSIKWNDSLGPFDLPLTPRQIIKDDTLSIGGFVR